MKPKTKPASDGASPNNIPLDDILLDARGHRCPVPTLKLRRRLEELTPGIAVALWADDPMAQVDVPHFCNQNNYLLLSQAAADTYWVFRIRRPA